jgi:hypothetical protein
MYKRDVLNNYVFSAQQGKNVSMPGMRWGGFDLASAGMRHADVGCREAKIHCTRAECSLDPMTVGYQQDAQE